MASQAVTFNLLPVHFFAFPSDYTRDQACFAVSLCGSKQVLVLLLSQVLHVVQRWVLLLQVGRNHKGRLPVLTQTGAQVQDFSRRHGGIPDVLLIWKPNFHLDMDVAVTKSLEQGITGTEHSAGGVAVTIFHHVPGDVVLELDAVPVWFSEHNLLQR